MRTATLSRVWVHHRLNIDALAVQGEVRVEGSGPEVESLIDLAHGVRKDRMRGAWCRGARRADEVERSRVGPEVLHERPRLAIRDGVVRRVPVECDRLLYKLIGLDAGIELGIVCHPQWDMVCNGGVRAVERLQARHIRGECKLAVTHRERCLDVDGVQVHIVATHERGAIDGRQRQREEVDGHDEDKGCEPSA